jgi:hypothetical protein
MAEKLVKDWLERNKDKVKGTSSNRPYDLEASLSNN